MICVICKNGETEPGVTTSTLELDSTILFIKDIPARVCNNCGEAYIDSQTLVNVHNMSPENSERDDDVDVVVLKYGPQELNGTMDPIQKRRALDFVDKIDRRPRVKKVVRGRGYDLEKPGSTRIGHIRYNIGGTDAGRYRVYAYKPFSDPEKRFKNYSESPTRGWTYVFNPANEEAMRYAISVLESSYDQK